MCAGLRRRGSRLACAHPQLRVWVKTPAGAQTTLILTALCCLARSLPPPPGVLQREAVALLPAGAAWFSPVAPSKRGAARGAGCTAPAPHRPSAPPLAVLGKHTGRAAALGGLWGLGGTRASTVSGSSPPPAHAPCTSEPAPRPFPAGLDQAHTLGAVAGAPLVGEGLRRGTLCGPHFLRRIGQMAAAALWAESAAPPEMCGVRKARRRGFLRGAASPAPPSRVGGGVGGCLT